MTSMQEFIAKNRNFLSGLPPVKARKRLLVEAPSEHHFITHCMAMQTVLLHQGQAYQPLWLKNDRVPLELLQSYVPAARFIRLMWLTVFDHIYISILVGIKWLLISKPRDILSFKFGGIRYGDILYDVYLNKNEIGTIVTVERDLYSLMYRIIRHHIRVRRTLRWGRIHGVLVSHRIGISAGVLVRVAIKMGKNVYTNSGMHRNTLFLSTKKSSRIEYEYTPAPDEINAICQLPDDVFNREYERIHHFHLFGSASADAKYAFCATGPQFSSKQEFCSRYNLDPARKNIFIMLHAFTDHPHSHFNGMLFNDYGDWFLRTFEYARSDSSVNWIFKQHPSDEFYPTKDIKFSEIFKNAPSHVLFLSTKDQLDTRALGVVADGVITCLGSAGFEIPAFFGLPSVTAGDNHYAGYSFTINPKTQDEYFHVLSGLKNVSRLSPMAQREARAVYMFIYYYATVAYSFIPFLAHKDLHDSGSNNTYWDKVLELYDTKRETIKKEIARYSFEVSRRNFKALRSSGFIPYSDYLVFPFNVTRPMPSCAIHIMREGCSILDELRIFYTLADGTLLGVYRDNRLIAHDTDIDISVLHPIDADQVIERFFAHGFKIGRFVTSYGVVQQIVFYKKETLFDIIFYQPFNGFAYAFCEKDLYFKHTLYHYLDPQPVQFEGAQFFIPKDPEAWLAHTYGPNWRIPNGKKPKDWREGGNQYLSAYPYDGDRLHVINEIMPTESVQLNKSTE